MFTGEHNETIGVDFTKQIKNEVSDKTNIS